MSLLRSQQEELEKHLDDILYTLSLQGYHRLVDTAGTTVFQTVLHNIITQIVLLLMSVASIKVQKYNFNIQVTSLT